MWSLITLTSSSFWPIILGGTEREDSSWVYTSILNVAGMAVAKEVNWLSSAW